MMKTKMMIAFALIGIFTLTSVAQNISIDYFGQTPPGDSAVVFAPGIISLPNRNETEIAFSPDGNEVYIVVNDGIAYTKYENNKWSDQIMAPFSGNDPFCSLDGKKIYFTIFSWNKTNTEVTSSDLYEVDRIAGGWSEPKKLPAPYNSDYYDGGYTETTDRVSYFNSNRSGSYSIWSITSDQAEKLNPIANFTNAVSPCVAPDGSYLVFESGRKGSYGNDDLYICFKKADNSWTALLNLNSSGVKINLAQHSQIYPSLSPDGKYLFFNRHNWTGLMPDIYWVSTHIFVGLKKLAFAPTLNKQIPELSIKTGSDVNYIIPDNTFLCEYGTETLKYTATLSDGSALPSWLHFNSETRTLSGSSATEEVDNIKITATNADKVSATCSFNISVTSKTAVDEIEENKIQIYPNPAQNILLIEYPGLLQKYINYKIVDLDGKTLQQGILKGNTIDVSKFIKGNYILKLNINGQIINEKIILQ